MTIWLQHYLICKPAECKLHRTTPVNLLFYSDLFGHVRLVVWIGLETVIIKTGKMN